MFLRYLITISVEMYFRGFEKDPRNSRFVIKTRVDKETLTGKYNLNGQILVLPIRGHGIATITFGKRFL